MVEAGRRRLLVVGDDAHALDRVVTCLQVAGFHIFQAWSGPEGLERLKTAKPHGLLLDLSPPGPDGFDVLERMKLPALRQRIRTLVLTARNQPSEVNRAIELGAQDILTRPFSDQQLVARCRRLLRSALEAETPGEIPRRQSSEDPLLL